MPKLKPCLELHDARARVPQVDLTVEVVEGLQPLDRVALDGRADTLAHGPIEVDKHISAQELVDLLLARPVAARQSLDGGRLVGGVVVDVQVRVGFEPVHDEVNEHLEGAPFGARRDRSVLDRPEGVERRLPVRIRATWLDNAEEVFDAVNLL